MSGSNRAKWAYINSSGSERSHWGKVYAIQKNREENGSSSPPKRTSRRGKQK